ncbi:uncharacterized protein LOC135115552 isoform X4 [Scylla paramamosain]|uniref:uncharacterized protein LOC135115552 isoform X4 n=1 Tax=Scylla paramamosain TaxID=85552 RepID=UPI00308347CB
MSGAANGRVTQPLCTSHPARSPVSRPRKSEPATPKAPQDKLIIFFRNEHVAVRNSEGTFFLCQVAQNVFKNTRKIKIRWLSPMDPDDKNCSTYTPDYYDITDFDCILTTVSLERIDRKTLRLRPEEETRINNILKRAMDVEKGVLSDNSNVNPDHPDGLDLSLYINEDQLKTRRKRSSPSKRKKKEESSGESGVESEDGSHDSEGEGEVSPRKAAKTPSRRKPRAGSKTPSTAKGNKASTPAAATKTKTR